MKGRKLDPVFRLEEAMEEAGIRSVTELSEASGVSRTTIYAILLNRSHQVRLQTLGDLARALKLKSPGDLVVWGTR